MDWSVIIFSPLSSCHFHHFTYGWILLIGFHDCQYSAKIIKFPQIKITAKIFPAKIYSRGNTVFSNLNSLHKNTVPRNSVCSVTTGLTFFSERTVELFVANYFSPTPPPTSHWETTTCFSICKSQSPLAREILLCERARTDHRRVPKDNHIF